MLRGLSAALLATSLVLLGAGNPWAEDTPEDVDDVLGGFDDGGGALGGFDDDETDYFEADAAGVDRWWDLLGNVSLATTFNYLEHDNGLPPASPDNRDYTGLSRLRLRGFLQGDARLPWEWRARASGYAFYDFSYLINDRESYTQQVLDTYEWDVELQDLYVEGSVAESFDMKLGRQVVNWGRSDSLRVTDIFNPLDLREPGLTDIDQIFRTITAAKFDYYIGQWNLAALVVPEIRVDKNPACGSDFYPILVPPGSIPPGFLPSCDFLAPENERPGPWGDYEVGGSLTGIYSGWDVSLYGAYHYDNRAHVELEAAPASPIGIANFLRYDRLWMVGAGGNLTVGSWLFKTEIAYQDGFNFTLPDPAPPSFRRSVQDRVDFMVGVEFYGVDDLTIGLEFVNRHYPSYDPAIGAAPYNIEQNQVEMAARVNWDLMNERLHLILVGVIFQVDASGGSFIRAEVNYDIVDALEIGGGFLFFQEGDNPGFGNIDDNDRIFVQLKYSF